MRNYNIISRKGIDMTAPTREELSDIAINASSDALVLYILYKSASSRWRWNNTYFKNTLGWSDSKTKRIRKQLVELDYLFIEKTGAGLNIYHTGKDAVRDYVDSLKEEADECN